MGAFVEYTLGGSQWPLHSVQEDDNVEFDEVSDVDIVSSSSLEEKVLSTDCFRYSG